MRIETDPRLPEVNNANFKVRLNEMLAKIARQLNGTSEGQIQAATNAATAAPSAPTQGPYQIGDVIRNSAPSALGSGTNQYLIYGWECVAAGSPGTWKELRFLTADASSGGGSGTAVSRAIAQTSHGLSAGQVARYTGSAYAAAQADSAANGEAVGIVSAVADANNFTITTHGYVGGLVGLTAGTCYFLSSSTAGALAATEPTTAGTISKPVFVADSTTSGYFINYRGKVNTTGGIASVVEVTTTTYTLLPNTRHIVNTATLCTLTLPATASQGDLFQVNGKGAGGWKVAQNSGQTIHSTSDTTTGTGGSMASSARYDNVVLVNITANTDFEATARNGSLIIV